MLASAHALQQLTNGLAQNGLLKAMWEKPDVYEAIFTGKASILFKWSYDDFIENSTPRYSEPGSIKHHAEVDCHKAFLDAMELVFHDGEYDYSTAYVMIKIFSVMLCQYH